MNVLGQVYDKVRGVLAPRRLSQTESAVQRHLDDMLAGRFPEPADSLARLLDFARTRVPYYRDLHRTHPLTPETLAAAPVLTKDLIRANFEALQDPDLQGRRHWSHASGGSTGKPVHVIHDAQFADIAAALRRYADILCFGGSFSNQVVLWGSAEEVIDTPPEAGPKQKAKDAALRLMGKKTTVFNTFDFSPQKMRDCVATLNRQKPEFILGYAGSVYQLARHMKENGVVLRRPPKAVLLTAETCHPFMREVIEEVLQCQVCNHYGSREVGPVSWEAADGRSYIFDIGSWIEVVDEANRPVGPGEEGRILVTTLHNHAMPLIRYDIGDRAVRGPEARLGDRVMPTFERIIGKTAEHFTTADGSLVHGQFFINLFYFRDWLDEYQVLQTALDEVRVLYKERGPAPEADLQEIAGKIRKAMGANCRVRWEKVEEIPKSAAGKYFYIKSMIS